MRILLTGASSFTGYWFARELARSGHEVVATLRRRSDEYEGIRRLRVDALPATCVEIVEECAFGEGVFLGLVERGGWDVLCHHGAETANYKDPGFDFVGALAGNARNADSVLTALTDRGCRRLVLTGSVFEADEGSGDGGELSAFSPYGLSKTLTHHAFRFHARAAGVVLQKFVIPNPFGPLEEPRFTSYLLTSWLDGKVPMIQTPDYVRDNIHVSLLARAYATFVGQPAEESAALKLNPSCYRETQRDFALRVAGEMEARLQCACPVDFAIQTEFPEPRVRVNTDGLDAGSLGWHESQAWDELGDFYLARESSESPA